MKRGKRKGANKDKVFGCDLLEHLHASGQEVPQVLRCCSEFIEEHGIVDGIYRLSGVSSNTQKLRAEFDTDNPDLNKDIYLQDIHCVSSLCKAYFRELPNPLLTYQLYDKFADAVALQLEEERLVKIKDVLKELPDPHYRTLQFLMQHLLRMASFSSQTNMHARNLAIVWAPNLLRSKDIESTTFNGTAAFMEVRVQSIVVEFILMHVEQLFTDINSEHKGYHNERRKSLPSPSCTGHQEDPFFRALPYHFPSAISPGDGPPAMRPYHAIIEVSDNKRKGSLKGRKWRSIFNLGRSNNDTKRKGKNSSKDKTKASLRPAKSMDSLSSVPCALEVQSRNSSQISLQHESLGPAEKEPQALCPSEQGSVQGSGYAVTYRRGAGASVSMVGRTEPSSLGSLAGLNSEMVLSKSPKIHGNRADKRAGMHISGPFSVTVPLHITSGLALGVLQGSSSELGIIKMEKPDSKDAKAEESDRTSRLLPQQQQEEMAPEKNEEKSPQEESVLDAKSGLLHKDHVPLENKGVEEEQYLNMRRDATDDMMGDMLFDLQDTFSFLDMIDREGGNLMNEFSVEPPCYEDEEGCLSFSSEMYEPPLSLSSEPDGQKLHSSGDEDDDNDQFHSVPDTLDFPQLRLPDTAAAVVPDDSVTNAVDAVAKPELHTTEPNEGLTTTVDIVATEGENHQPEPEQETAEASEIPQVVPEDPGLQSVNEEPHSDMGAPGDICQDPQELREGPESEELADIQTDGDCKVHFAPGEGNEIVADINIHLEPETDTPPPAFIGLHKDSDVLSQRDETELRIIDDCTVDHNSDTVECTRFSSRECCSKTKVESENIEIESTQNLGNLNIREGNMNHPEGNGLSLLDPGSQVAPTISSQVEQDFNKPLQKLSDTVSDSSEMPSTHLNECGQHFHSAEGHNDSSSESLIEIPIIVVQLAEMLDSFPENLQEHSEPAGSPNINEADTGSSAEEVVGRKVCSDDLESLEEDKSEALQGEPEIVLDDSVKPEEVEDVMEAAVSGRNEDAVLALDPVVDGTGDLRNEATECVDVKDHFEQELSHTMQDEMIEEEILGDLMYLNNEGEKYDADGGARMKLAVSFNGSPKLYQARSFPVVPPKPQFSKLPPALQMRHQLHHHLEMPIKESENGEREAEKEAKREHEGDRGGGSKTSNNMATSMSFDEAVARAKDRNSGKTPVRWKGPYSEQSSPTTSPVSHRLARHAFSDITCHASPTAHVIAVGAVSKRMSLPRMGQRFGSWDTDDEQKLDSVKTQKRRSIAALEMGRDKDRE
ncbi:rho GTPase-activating protein 30 isoform X2 [Amia ocellicauda]|uniref:rho GTPase-activating protein 30 isoform X2 n=1 Tax=Amia ocellicauda TaxID=2972642 RepID=UPI0034643045